MSRAFQPRSTMQTASDRVRLFTLRSPADSAGVTQIEDYYFTYTRRLGARKFFTARCSGQPDLRFAVWAPNAQQVDVVFGQPANGYIADDGDGIDPARAPLPPLNGGGRDLGDRDRARTSRRTKGCRTCTASTNAEGRTVYRTDIFSRQQIGRGTENPAWPSLDRQSGPARRHQELQSGRQPGHGVTGVDAARRAAPGTNLRREFLGARVHARPAGAQPYRGPGHLRAARRRARFRHVAARQSRGRDGAARSPERPRRQRGRTAADVGVLRRPAGATATRTTSSSSRAPADATSTSTSCGSAIGAASPSSRTSSTTISIRTPIARSGQYDSDAPEQNIYYWYEGTRADYAISPTAATWTTARSGFTPRFWEEMVRHLFVSSAAAFVEELHVDGLRVDLTQAIHRDNVLHADGRSVGNANLFGAEDAARMEPHAAADQADGDADRRGPHRLGRGHAAARGRRARLRRHLVCRPSTTT